MDDDKLFWGWIVLFWTFCVGAVLGIMFGWYAARANPVEPLIIPCAVPVFVESASTVAELEERAAFKMDAMRSCAKRIEDARSKR